MTTDLRSFHPIGYIHSAQGLKGEIFIVLKAIDESWLDSWNELVVSQRVDENLNEVSFTLSPQVYPIESLRLHKKQGKSGVVLAVDGVKSMTDAEKLVGHTVWIPKVFLQSRQGENIFLQEIAGFTVVDHRLGELGPIVGFSSNGPQDLLEVTYKGENHYVPLIQAFIENIDKKNRKIFMVIPEGLLE